MTKPLFIYFRHTPAQIKFIVSYDVTPMGQPKKYILRNDENVMFAEYVLNCLKTVIKNERSFTRSGRPDFAAIVKYLVSIRSENHSNIAGLSPAVVKFMSQSIFSHVLHIPADGKMGERIMFVPATTET